MLFHVGYAATLFCETSCYHLPIYAKVSPLAFFRIFLISYCYVVMVIFIYTKLGAPNMVIRVTEKTWGLYENTEAIVGAVYVNLYEDST